MHFAIIYVILTLCSTINCNLANKNHLENRYCNHPDCALKSQHTLCAVSGVKSPRLYSAGMTEWMRSQILLLHNRYRDSVSSGLEAGQPSAANMRKMYWDIELESFAEAWARQCQNRHDECRNTLSFNVLQNMDVRPVVSHMTQAQLLADVVGSWFSGARLVQRDKITYFRLDNCSSPGGCISHMYATAAWASTWRLGCSQALCMVKKEFCDSDKDENFFRLSGAKPDLNTTENTSSLMTRGVPDETMSNLTFTTNNLKEKSKSYGETSNMSNKAMKDTRLVAYTFCNYGPAGNIEGMSIYEPGPTCSRCPVGTRCGDTLRGLCTLYDDLDK